MIKNVLPCMDYQPRFPGLMRWSALRTFWVVGFLLSSVLLSGCSLKPDSVRLSQQQLQQLVNAGFLAPQIRTFDLQPFMVVQIYLDAPTVSIDGESAMLRFVIEGRLDAEILTGQITEQLPIVIKGRAGLLYDPAERSIVFRRVELEDAQIDLDIALLRTLILEQFQKALAEELEDIALISLPRVPEFEEQLMDLSAEKKIQIQTQEGGLVFLPEN